MTHPRWYLAERALVCLALGGADLGGLHLRARVGPVRDRFTNALEKYAGPFRRLTPDIGDEALFGGIDVAASLSAGTVVETQGLLQSAGGLVLPMAERARPALAARLANALDMHAGLMLVAIDEGVDDETLAPTLAERLGLALDLGGLALSDAPPFDIETGHLDLARAASPTVPEGAIQTLAIAAATLGVRSLRAPVLALRAAALLSAWDGRDTIGSDALTEAVALVLAPRATQLPGTDAEETDDKQDPPNLEPDDQVRDENDGRNTLPNEVVLEAVRAMLPENFLDRMIARSAVRKAAAGSGAGDRRRSNRRGRPLPARQGTADREARIDLIATLRVAAPWQRVRKLENPGRGGLHIDRSDLRIRQYEERSDRAIIFTVDASGSAALARLAEAKGAIEILLAQAYARRDYVALIAFRGAGAELLLPPTRSLVQTKRRLAALPGGGGTPLASGLREAFTLALNLRGRGMTPTVALLTDGRANVTLEGTGGRAKAQEEAEGFARQIMRHEIPAVVIDTGLRPTGGLAQFAAVMGAGYLALPRADAERLARAVSGSMAE
ncbi:MAG: magnesium chelatase subunit D [Pseudomonadota bacterium]